MLDLTEFNKALTMTAKRYITTGIFLFLTIALLGVGQNNTGGNGWSMWMVAAFLGITASLIPMVVKKSIPTKLSVIWIVINAIVIAVWSYYDPYANTNNQLIYGAALMLLNNGLSIYNCEQLFYCLED